MLRTSRAVKVIILLSIGKITNIYCFVVPILVAKQLHSVLIISTNLYVNKIADTWKTGEGEKLCGG